MQNATIVKFENEYRADIARQIAPGRYEVVLAAYWRGEQGPQRYEYTAFAGYVRDGASIQFKSISALSGEEAIATAIAAIEE
jgi:hypothetical protein